MKRIWCSCHESSAEDLEEKPHEPDIYDRIRDLVRALEAGGYNAAPAEKLEDNCYCLGGSVIVGKW